MAYTKHTWTKGEVISNVNLNNIENFCESADANLRAVGIKLNDLLENDVPTVKVLENPETAQASDIANKLNELINALYTIGFLTDGAPRSIKL